MYRGVVGRSVALLATGMLAGCASMNVPPRQDQAHAVAPTGELRAGFLSVPLYATKDPATGELKGHAVDLGKELASRLGIPFRPVAYSSLPAMLAGLDSGEWDVAMMGINAEREKVVTFSPPYLTIEWGYLVPAGSAITTSSDVDRPGVRVGVLEKGAGDLFLSRSLTSAWLVRAPTPATLGDLLSGGKVDVLAATKPSLYGMAASAPGSRVLEEHFTQEMLGMAVPKDRPDAAAHVRAFVERAKSEGVVARAIDRAGLRGVHVPIVR